jgi:hypothetical protein
MKGYQCHVGRVVISLLHMNQNYVYWGLLIEVSLSTGQLGGQKIWSGFFQET